MALQSGRRATTTARDAPRKYFVDPAAVEIDNVELYDAMIPDLGTRAGGFLVEETADGIRVIFDADEG